MTHHVIIGGGPVATNALETIRSIDGGDSRITLISDEPAHSRMALPYWLSGQVPREQTYTADDAYYARHNVDARIGTRVTAVDPDSKAVSLSDGSTLEFDDLLIATGSSPAGLPVPGTDLPGVQPLWSLEHTEQLLAATKSLDNPRVVMIGAGFIGFIMLNAMYKRGWNLSVVERETHVLPRMLDDQSSGLVEDWLRSKNVAVHCKAQVQGITQNDAGAKIVELADGKKIEADVVIIATGIKPNIDFLDGSGIETDGGIPVNGRMQTNCPHIYAGGDIAAGPSLFGGNAIHAIQPTAVDHGRIAGANMAGEEVCYPGSLLMNILDVCGLQNASFGDWSDPDAEVVTICNPEGSVYRRLLWTGDEITGAIFVGKPNDLGMLTDVGMVKGIMQTRTHLGPWKTYLMDNPFDIRRAYIASGVAGKLVQSTLLGRPSQPRDYRFDGSSPQTEAGSAHQLYVGLKK